MSYLSNLETNLIVRMSNQIYNMCDSNLINKTELEEAQSNLKNSEDKFIICSNLETLYYIHSVLLSEIRDKKRNVMSSIFEQNVKLSQEKSVLKEKLDAIPEYANLHKIEEMLFQLIEHLQNIKNNITFMLKEDVENE